MKKISISLYGHQTSISLEDEFVTVLKQIAKEQKISVASIISHIDDRRDINSNLSSEIRVWILKQVMKN